jgi:hypothetical protein
VRQRIVASVIVLFLSAAWGCQGEDKWLAKRPKLETGITGEVHYNGKPLADAEVVFTHPASGNASWAVTDADGRFSLTTFQPGDGAIIGDNLVTVSKYRNEMIPAPQLPPEAFTDPKNPPPKEIVGRRIPVIPARYADATTSGLTATIATGGTKHFVFELAD